MDFAVNLLEQERDDLPPDFLGSGVEEVLFIIAYEFREEVRD